MFLVYALTVRLNSSLLLFIILCILMLSSSYLPILCPQSLLFVCVLTDICCLTIARARCSTDLWQTHSAVWSLSWLEGTGRDGCEWQWDLLHLYKEISNLRAPQVAGQCPLILPVNVKTWFRPTVFKSTLTSSQETQSVSITKTNWLMLFRDLNRISLENGKHKIHRVGEM
jgi:hypothetical protein